MTATEQPTPHMTKHEFRGNRSELNLTQQGLGTVMGTDIRTIRRYESGERPIPKSISILILILVSIKDTRTGKIYGV